MGLFNRNKKCPEEKYQELYDANMQSIENAAYQVLLDFVVGQYGNEDIIAGSMMGGTGKLIAMSKYGDLKWEQVTVSLLTYGIQINYMNIIFYSDIIDVRVGDNGGFLNIDKQLIIVTPDESYIFKGNTVFVDVIVDLIVGSRQRYLGWIDDGLINQGQVLQDGDVDKLDNGECLIPKSQRESDGNMDNTDRLLRAAELYERGLLTEDEFEELKKKLL